MKPLIATIRDLDSYERIFDQESSSIKGTHDKLKLKRVMSKRIIERETEYLVKWKDYNN